MTEGKIICPPPLRGRGIIKNGLLSATILLGTLGLIIIEI